MQDFVIGIPKVLFSNTFFTSQYFRLYHFNEEKTLCQIKVWLPGHLPKLIKIHSFVINWPETSLFQGIFFQSLFQSTGRVLCVTLIGGIGLIPRLFFYLRFLFYLVIIKICTQKKSTHREIDFIYIHIRTYICSKSLIIGKLECVVAVCVYIYIYICTVCIYLYIPQQHIQASQLIKTWKMLGEISGFDTIFPQL